MTLSVPEELERDLTRRAQELGLEPSEVVRRAVARFLYLEPDLEAELEDWQRATWKAWATVEESAP
jgi:predicted transcriptional regulator